MVIVRALIHNYRVGDTRSFVCYLCLDANPLESLRLHLYFIRSSHVPLSGCLSLTINLDKSFPSTPLRLWTRSSLWATSSSASREHRIHDMLFNKCDKPILTHCVQCVHAATCLFLPLLSSSSFPLSARGSPPGPSTPPLPPFLPPSSERAI